jgi:hypothetical protein
MFRIVFCFFFAFAFRVSAQDLKTIRLDSVTIVAVKGGFKVSDFIELVKNDTSFYQAFKNLRSYPHKSYSSLFVYDTKKQVKAALFRKSTQYVKDKKRWLVIDSNDVKGKLQNRKQQYKSYTTELYDFVFFPRDTAGISLNNERNPSKANKSNEEKLKTLIFNPGMPIAGVPLVGHRMAIFDAGMVPYYDYEISSTKYKDTVPCYVFRCSAKKDLGYFSKDKPVIKEIVSYFSKKTFFIVSRRYHLSYDNPLFDFDVNMEVRLTEVKGILFPEFVRYQGHWDIPFKAPEIVNFDVNFYNFKVE